MKHASTASFRTSDFSSFDSVKFAKLLQQKEHVSRWQLFWNAIEQRRKEIQQEILSYSAGRK